jgi:hypothetical protein
MKKSTVNNPVSMIIAEQNGPELEVIPDSWYYQDMFTSHTGLMEK